MAVGELAPFFVTIFNCSFEDVSHSLPRAIRASSRWDGVTRTSELVFSMSLGHTFHDGESRPSVALTWAHVAGPAGAQPGKYSGRGWGREVPAGSETRRLSRTGILVTSKLKIFQRIRV